MLPTLEESYAYCTDLTRRRARNFYYAFITLPKEKRKAIYAAYAFCRLSDDYSDEEIPLDEKAALLTGLHRELDEAFEGNPESPLFVALLDSCRKFGIPKDYFHEIINGVEMDLVTNSYQSFEDLYQYCYHVASVVGLVSIEIFEYTDSRAKEFATDMGIAMQLTNILRDIEEDCGRGRVYLPLNELAEHGVTPESLQAGDTGPEFREMMVQQVNRARDYFERSAGLLPLLAPRSRLCPAVLRALYSKLLDRIEARDYNVFGERITLSSREKLGLTARVWSGTMLRNLVRRW